MSYDQQTLDQIESYASIFLPISDMAVILDIHPEQLRMDIANRTTEVSKRYHRGKAASKVKLLHQEMQLAYVGSPLALENTQKNLMSMEDDEWWWKPSAIKMAKPYK